MKFYKTIDFWISADTCRHSQQQWLILNTSGENSSTTETFIVWKSYLYEHTDKQRFSEMFLKVYKSHRENQNTQILHED